MVTGRPAHKGELPPTVTGMPLASDAPPTMSVFTTTLIACVLFVAILNLVLGAQALLQSPSTERRMFSAAGPFGVTLFALAWFVSILNPLAFQYMRVAAGYAAALSVIGYSLDLILRSDRTVRHKLLLFAGVTLAISVFVAWRLVPLDESLELRVVYPRAVSGPLLLLIAVAAAAGMRGADQKVRRFFRRVFAASTLGAVGFALCAVPAYFTDEGVFIDPAVAALFSAQLLTFVYAFERKAEAREVLSRLLTYVVLAVAVALAAGIAFYRLGYPRDPVVITVSVTVALVSSVLFLALSERMTRVIEKSLFPDHASLRHHLSASRAEVATLRRRLNDVERLAVAGELAAKVAHEVKNPLAAVRGYAQLMGNALDTIPPAAREQFEKGLRIIRDESDRIDAQVRELLTLGQRRGPASRDQQCNLNHLVLEAVAVAEGDAATRIEVELVSELGSVRGNADELRGALLNILKNAVEACRSKVRVRTRVTDTQAFVEVLDDGNGFGADALPKMFSPFFTTKPRGTGLGLCIAKSALEAAGGDIAVANRTDGSGALVTLTLHRTEATVGAEAA